MKTAADRESSTLRRRAARCAALLFVAAAMAACGTPVSPDVIDVQMPPADTSMDIVDTGQPIDVTGDRAMMDCPTGQIRCNGVCVDTSSDAANCGTCGNNCGMLPGVSSSARCVAGMCNITGACQADRADCDRMVANGCEVQLNSAMNCGACGVTCSEPTPMCTMVGASYTCANSCTGSTPNRCGMTCVNISTDITNCGICGRNCPAPMNGSATCSAGACGTRCNPGFHACGDQCVSDTSPLSCGSRCTPCPAPLNATATCDGATCGFRCNTGFHQCGDQCVPDNSINSCGTSCSPCAARGNATTTCDGRACGFTCTSGFADCNSDATDGCESALNTAGACGRCGNVCSGATPFCVPQTGGTFACLSACSGTGVRMCGPFCINTLTDPLNCGTCDNRCPTVANGAPVCTSGTCEIQCNAGFHLCGGVCVSNTDVATCGSSCSPCPGTANGSATCDGNACGLQCDLGFSLCGGTCRATGDTTACGPACTPCAPVANGRPICERDMCLPICSRGYHLCDGTTCRNDTSPESCGSRCEPCSAPMFGIPTCNAGTCDFTCMPGYSRCGTICVPTPGAMEPPYCDDGNNNSGDGCGNTCRTESGWYCSGPLPGGQTCTTRCGDGLAVLGREACDFDVRTGLPAVPAIVTPQNNDGCSASCTPELTYTCRDFAPVPNVCEPNCGNGRLDPGETCDDGNSNNADGCASCIQQPGWLCNNTGVAPNPPTISCSTVCGDGIIVSGREQCDDGGRLTTAGFGGGTGGGGDGCSATCLVEPGFACTTTATNVGGTTYNLSICSQGIAGPTGLPVVPPDGASMFVGGTIASPFTSSCVIGTGTIVNMTWDPSYCTSRGCGHTWASDLIIRFGVNGNYVNLHAFNHGSNDLMGSYSFSDAAANPWSSVGAVGGDVPTGTYRPVSALSGLNGIAANGSFTLEASDGAGLDTGRLSDFSATIRCRPN